MRSKTSTVLTHHRTFARVNLQRVRDKFGVITVKSHRGQPVREKFR